MVWGLDNLFSTPPISSVTINWVLLSPTFRSLLYILVAGVFFGALIVQLVRGPLRTAFASAVLMAFFTATIASAIQADIGWYSWLALDKKKFGGRATEEKLAVMEGPLYEVIRNIRRVVRSDYALFSADDFMRRRTEYFLLPLRKRERADNVIVMEDRLARYDLPARIFTRGEVTLDHLEMVYMYGFGVYVLRKQ